LRLEFRLILEDKMVLERGYARHLSSYNIFIDKYVSMCEKISINAKSNERNELGNTTWVLNLN